MALRLFFFEKKREMKVQIIKSPVGVLGVGYLGGQIYDITDQELLTKLFDGGFAKKVIETKIETTATKPKRETAKSKAKKETR